MHLPISVGTPLTRMVLYFMQSDAAFLACRFFSPAPCWHERCTSWLAGCFAGAYILAVGMSCRWAVGGMLSLGLGSALVACCRAARAVASDGWVGSAALPLVTVVVGFTLRLVHPQHLASEVHFVGVILTASIYDWGWVYKRSGGALEALRH